jgi:sphinganine-1-phosphate aldolase
MITAQHLPVVDDYLRDLRDAVATVKADPSLAGKGRAATYGMMAHLPLRGMVRNKVLTLFANAYRAGGAPLELEADAGASRKPLLERVAAWYVARQQRR